MAPEMINGESYDFAADWWAVGILMYEMRFGKTPFMNKNRAILSTNIVNAEVNWPNQTQYPRSEHFDDLVSKLLTKD